MNRYVVNIGDGDVLTIEAKSLTSLERCIKKMGEFEPWMINAVVKRGHEMYLESFVWKQVLAPTPDNKEE